MLTGKVKINKMNTQLLETRLGSLLKPVTPRPEFVSELKAQLAEPRQMAAPARSPLWLIVAGIGGVVSVAGVALVVFRLGGSLARRAAEVWPRSGRMASASR